MLFQFLAVFLTKFRLRIKIKKQWDTIQILRIVMQCLSETMDILERALKGE